MKVNFFDLSVQYEQIQSEISESLAQIFETQQFILGKNVANFEEAFAKYCGTKYAVAVSSGTDALLAALMALNIDAGDEVILPDFTFFATAGVVSRLKAKPIFVDIDPKTFNINPELVEKAITKNTKAIIPVHIFGQCADMESLQNISQKHNIPLIEDACQAVGAEYKDGKKAGSFGIMGCFSFYPTKNLGGAGDSGAITTNDENIYKKLKQMRNHGMEPKYHHSFIGGNFRMDEIQAAILLKKLNCLDNWNNLRRINAGLYSKFFYDKNLVDLNCINQEKRQNAVILPHQTHSNLGIIQYHTFHQYSILVKNRDNLKQFLAENSIGTDIYYPIPLHRQECFKELNCKESDFPVTNKVCEEVISLPIYPEISENAIKYVVEKIAEYYKK
jgi:dTDP-4-amino-4,6-dideoxygalactose transaminase